MGGWAGAGRGVEGGLWGWVGGGFECVFVGCEEGGYRVDGLEGGVGEEEGVY